MISFILLNDDIRCPRVAGGNYLRIPVFGKHPPVRWSIKRKIDPLMSKEDQVYRAFLHTYLQKVQASGHNVHPAQTILIILFRNGHGSTTAASR